MIALDMVFRKPAATQLALDAFSRFRTAGFLEHLICFAMHLADLAFSSYLADKLHFYLCFVSTIWFEV